MATGSDYNVHLGASGTYVFSPADQGQERRPRIRIRFRERPEIRVDSVRPSTPGSIDADHASVYGMEFGANWKSLYLQGEHFWFDITRPASSAVQDPRLHGLLPAGQLDTHRREPPL